MMPSKHIMVSGGVSAMFYAWAQSWEAALACFLSGIFIDLDHHLDYYLNRKEVPISYKKLVKFLQYDFQSKRYLFLHSYEFLFTVWFLIIVLDLNLIWRGVAIGFTTHVLCDEIANPLRPLAYFLIYRAKNRFNQKSFFKKGFREYSKDG